jgi:hypothetical protein
MSQVISKIKTSYQEEFETIRKEAQGTDDSWYFGKLS